MDIRESESSSNWTHQGNSKRGRENLGSMDLNGRIHSSKSIAKLRGLSANDLNQLRNFVLNNKYALEHIADMDIHIGQIWSDIIKGGEPASFEEIQKLNLKVDELIERNNSLD